MLKFKTLNSELFILLALLLCLNSNVQSYEPLTSDLSPYNSSLIPQTSNLRPQSSDLSLIFSAFPFSGGLTDCSGNSYNTVYIGSQQWMVENLRTKSYCDGTVIKKVTKEKDWHNLKEGAYCVYNEDDKEDYAPDFGLLYNWYAVNDERQLCPKGWHIPTDNEWKILVEYLGGMKIAGGKMKYDKSVHWKKINQGATNESGFKAVPGGYRYANGDCDLVGTNAYWWSSTPTNEASAWSWGVSYSNKGVTRYNATKKDGMSVRCLKD
jgi:uncharacterized protein (TIGR02145 family)